MAKLRKNVKRKEAESVEVEPDAWERFESAVRKVVPSRQPKDVNEDAPDGPPQTDEVTQS
jgi:hypothetical protein